MTFDEWVAGLPTEIKGDTLWKVEAYRLALLAAEIGWHDATELMKDRRTIGLADQLYRSLGSISANLAEGYSHHTGRSRAQFYQYSLGSARESRDWYYKSHHVLKEEVVRHRISLLTHIIKLLLTMIPQQRGKALKESSVPYLISTASLEAQIPITTLLEQIPLP
jgi:four helix bundle protein